MKVTFRTYCGLAGDLQELLIAKSDTGIEESELIYRVGWFRYYRMKIAKKRLIKRLELLTGSKHVEQYYLSTPTPNEYNINKVKWKNQKQKILQLGLQEET